MQVRIDNAREEEQKRRMLDAQARGVCFLCEKGKVLNESGTVHLGRFWFVKQNDFPYKGSVHHYLIVSREHLTGIDELGQVAIVELFDIAELLRIKLQVGGFSLFVRSGDMSLTGATLDHLHFHFLVGHPKTEETTENDRLTVTLGYSK